MFRVVYASVSMALDSVTFATDLTMNLTSAILSSEAFYIMLGVVGLAWILRG